MYRGLREMVGLMCLSEEERWNEWSCSGDC